MLLPTYMLRLYVHRYIDCELANSGEEIRADHYTLYSSIYPPFTHLKNHNRISFISEQKWEDKGDLLEAARSSCGLKKPQQGL